MIMVLFTMFWNKIDGADKYEVYVLNNSTGKYQLNGTVAKTSATTALALMVLSIPIR